MTLHTTAAEMAAAADEIVEAVADMTVARMSRAQAKRFGSYCCTERAEMLGIGTLGQEKWLARQQSRVQIAVAESNSTPDCMAILQLSR